MRQDGRTSETGETRKEDSGQTTEGRGQQDDTVTRPPRLKAKPMAGRRGETERRRFESN